jgi:hypothetical protein
VTGNDDATPADDTAGLVTVFRVTEDGAAELLQIEPHRDDVALLVGRSVEDVTARVCVAIPGGPVTFWTAQGAARRGKAVNRCATDAAIAFLPRIEQGDLRITCTNRARLEREPLRGVVLVTGYDQASGAVAALTDVAVEKLRGQFDGRAERRARAAQNLAVAEVVHVAPEEGGKPTPTRGVPAIGKKRGAAVRGAS